MASSKPCSLYLRSTSAVSLNERFSQILVDQLTQPTMVNLNPILQQQGTVFGTPPTVLLVRKKQVSHRPMRATGGPGWRCRKRKRRSVWTRLGWRQVTCCCSASRPRGFWSFMNKYRWRPRFTSTYRSRRNLQSQLGQHLLQGNTNILTMTAGQHLSLHLSKGRVTASRECDLSRDKVPTKMQLDAQLDEYMSMSRSRLDAELDEYMSMAGETQLYSD
uniref:uncharacterized protein LOC109970884 isoform X2 n=1 Tax=Monopterus albus TaxID=43700 RepID=UPI0009B358CD|nr:uncharacterized protein LOC109970884 isoform X2 [Monopterus albus]